MVTFSSTESPDLVNVMFDGTGHCAISNLYSVVYKSKDKPKILLSPPVILLTAEAIGDADPAVAKSVTSVPVNALIIVLDNNESARGPFFVLISTSCPIIFTSLVLFSSSYPILILGDWITISRLASRTICFPLILTAPFLH